MISLGLLRQTTNAEWIESEKGWRRKVVCIGGSPYLIDPDAPGRKPEPTTNSDIARLKLGERDFAEWIASSNSLRGKREFSRDIWTLGRMNIGELKADCFFVPCASRAKAAEILLSEAETILVGYISVVLCALMDWIPAAIVKQLERRRVIVTEMSQLIDGLQICISKVDIPTIETHQVTGQEVIRHIDKRFDTIGQNFNEVREENERLKGSMAEQLVKIGQNVDPKFFQWVMAMLGAGSSLAASKILKIPNSTLSGNLKKFEKRGGVYKTLMDVVRIRQRAVGKKSMERFNDQYLEHQGSGEASSSNDQLLTEVFEGLEQMSGANWQRVRDELLEFLAPELGKNVGS